MNAFQWPERVTIREVGLRDGLQSIARTLPTAQKLQWIQGAYDAGIREIEDLKGKVVSANQGAPGLEACLGQGREIGITGIVCTQRPTRVPPAIMSEADHVFVFTLNRRDDRDTVSETIGDYSGPAVWHGFVYWHGDLTQAVDCRPLDRVR